MSKITSIARIIFALIWIYSVYYDVVYQPRLGHEWYIYKLVMLTNLNFILITTFSVVSALSSFSFCSFLKPVANFMFFTSVFPIGVTTCLLFWGLYVINPELVMPAWVARLIPEWLNHVTHTLPIIHLIFESITGNHQPPQKTTSLIMSSVLVAFYFGIILFVRAVDGYWLYPLLELFQVEHFIGGYFVALGGYFGLIMLAQVTSRVLGKDEKKHKRR